MKRWLLYLFMAGIFASCNDPDDSAMSGPAKDPVSKFAVSTETALGNLEAALKALQSGDTRAGTPARRVESIRPLKLESIALKTRSGSVPDADNLLYVVAFEDGRGSAVLGADTRVASVYAILDESVFTPADFVQTATRSIGEEGEEEISEFLTGLILDDALWRIENAVPSGSGIDFPGGDGGPVRAPTYSKVYKDKKAQQPLLQTKWHQSSPYNDQCDWNSTHTGRCPAGCTNIATGQILAYNQSGSTITIAGTSFAWNLINQCKYGSYPSFDARSEIARFIHTIGVWMNTTYRNQSSTTPIANTLQMFRHAGYQGVDLIGYDKAKARTMIYSNKAPFYMYGANTANAKAHAWVIDGWNEYTLQDWMTTYGPNNRINPPVLISEVYHCYVHCNFGWGGACDGYYWWDSFDTNQRLDSSKIDGSVGDYASESDYPYNDLNKMIIYDK